MKRARELPFEGGDIDGVGADEARRALDFVGFQDGKCPPLYLAERDPVKPEKIDTGAPGEDLGNSKPSDYRGRRIWK
jgi:hypothetical protein